ncbi:MAG: hypothetical protein L6422_01215 [Candidatus Marinimicrobia bacterium]|nr:hypothetical protein [bacterium]MCG2714900.1 hypothetical protein [Candidatus Neomarinimicrobiota bacterium]
MTGIENQVLRIIKELKEAGKDTIARKMGVSEEYIAEICQNLISDGYLKARGDGKYGITEKSIKEINPVKTRGPIAILKGGN